jgi:probable HAF family extracellular repeat protein
MQRTNTLTLVAALPALAASTLAMAALPPYIVKDLGTHAGFDTKLEPGSVGCSIAGGKITGYAVTSLPQRNFHAFRSDGSSLTDLIPLAADEHTIGFGINANGDVVGVSYKLGELASHGMLWGAGGRVTTLGSLEPHDINSAGTIVGSTPVSGLLGASHATRRIGNVSTDLGTLGGVSSMAMAVNESNWVVGESLLANNKTTRAFLVANGTMLDLGSNGGTHSRALDINGLSVVGIAETAANTPRATLWTLTASGTLSTKTNLGTLPGAINSAAYGVNSAGSIVGNSGDAAFLWSAGTMSNLNALIAAGNGWHLTKATGIDNEGRIVGVGKHFGLQRAFELLPRAAADLDADGSVGATDLALLLGAWDGSDATFDLTGDGQIGAADLAVLLGAWS